VDVTREADVVEEILRIFGFNNVPIPAKLNTSLPLFKKPDPEKLQTTISEMLVGMGCIETMNNSLTKAEYAEKVGGEVVKAIRNVEMLNPLSLDLNVMRQTLIFNALETVVRNQNRQNADLKIFEFGKIYHKFEDGYSENRRLIIALSGKREPENWNSTGAVTTYFTIKGTVKAMFQRIGLDGMIKESSIKTSLLQDGVQLSILKRKVGELGWISPELKKYFGIKNDVFIADLDWDVIIDSLKFVKVKYTELPKTFAVRRDFSLLLDQKITFAEIEELAKGCDTKILREVGLFDVYEGKNLEEGKKSYAVSFKFQDMEKTLQDQQVDSVMDKIRGQLETKLGAQLR
jgi:phenylalanyl-tRNA synthetase beta chain